MLGNVIVKCLIVEAQFGLEGFNHGTEELCHYPENSLNCRVDKRQRIHQFRCSMVDALALIHPTHSSIMKIHFHLTE
jgi:hypothetical protein